MKIFNHQIKSVKLIPVLAFFLFAFIAGAPAAKAAETATFLIDSAYDITERTSATATNRITGLNAYYYVDDFYWNSIDSQKQNAIIADITALSSEFDNVIYPKMHDFYGEEWTPGIDEDKKIYILLTDIKKDTAKGSYGGYFSTTNEYSKTLLDEYKKSQLTALENEKANDPEAEKNIDSYRQKENEINSIFTNEKELIYLNINFVDRPDIKSFLAHEFQHLINWNQKTKIFNISEDIWLNEALSEYAPTALKYDNTYKGSSLESTVSDFNRNPSDSLIEWENSNNDYSNVNIFMQFLVGRYGTGILKLINTTSKTGIDAINDSLQKIGAQENFNNIFSDWVIANYFNGQTIQNKKYGYANPDLNYENLHISPTSSFMIYSNNIAKNAVIKGEKNIKSWSGLWYQFISSSVLSAPNQTLKINLSTYSDKDYLQTPYVIEDFNGNLTLKSFELLGVQNGNIYIDNFGTTVKSVTIMPINEKQNIVSNKEIPLKFSYSASIVSPNPLIQPSIKNISPAISELGNRTLVTITGENFASGLTVKFGGIPATEVSLIDSKTVIAKAPPFYNNTQVDVEIINLDLSNAIAQKSFTYSSQVRDGSLIKTEGDHKVYVVTGKYRRWIQSEKIFNFYNFRWSDIKTVTPEIENSFTVSALIRADKDQKVYEIGSDGKKHHLSMSWEKFISSGRRGEMIFTVNDAEKNYYKTGAIITK